MSFTFLDEKAESTVPNCLCLIFVPMSEYFFFFRCSMFSVSLVECWFVPAGDWEARNWRERRHQHWCRWTLLTTRPPCNISTYISPIYHQQWFRWILLITRPPCNILTYNIGYITHVIYHLYIYHRQWTFGMWTLTTTSRPHCNIFISEAIYYKVVCRSGSTLQYIISMSTLNDILRTLTGRPLCRISPSVK